MESHFRVFFSVCWFISSDFKRIVWRISRAPSSCLYLTVVAVVRHEEDLIGSVVTNHSTNSARNCVDPQFAIRLSMNRRVLFSFWSQSRPQISIFDDARIFCVAMCVVGDTLEEVSVSSALTYDFLSSSESLNPRSDNFRGGSMGIRSDGASEAN
jgi:hypothetical protein